MIYYIRLRHVEFVVKCKTPYVSSKRSIREFAPNVPVYMFTAKGEYEMMTLDQLMPKSFGPEDLSPVEELSH